MTTYHSALYAFILYEWLLDRYVSYFEMSPPP